MSLLLDIRFLQNNNIVPTIKKIYIKEENRLILKRVNPDTLVDEIIDFDYRDTLVDGVYSVGTNYSENVYQVVVENDKTLMYITGNILANEIVPNSVNTEITNFTNITYIYLAPGETEIEEPITIIPDFLPKNISYEEKQERAIYAIENVWRKQKQQWMREAVGYSDLNPDIVKHASYWLKAADQALLREFQNPDTDPLVVEAMARKAAEGAADIDSVEAFAKNLNTYTSAFPDGPQNAILWVSRGDGQDPRSIETLELQGAFNYAGQDVVIPLDTDYDPTDHNALTSNQPGIGTIVNEANVPLNEASITDNIIAFIRDPDSIKGATVTYQWQKLNTDINQWEDIINETNIVYVVDLEINNQLRFISTYEDNFGPNQTVISESIIII